MSILEDIHRRAREKGVEDFFEAVVPSMEIVKPLQPTEKHNFDGIKVSLEELDGVVIAITEYRIAESRFPDPDTGKPGKYIIVQFFIFDEINRRLDRMPCFFITGGKIIMNEIISQDGNYPVLARVVKHRGKHGVYFKLENPNKPVKG